MEMLIFDRIGNLSTTPMNRFYELYWEKKLNIQPYQTLLFLHPKMSSPFLISDTKSFIDVLNEKEQMYQIEEILAFAKEVIYEGAGIAIMPISQKVNYNGLTLRGDEIIRSYKSSNESVLFIAERNRQRSQK